MSAKITIFSARKVVTMNPSNPESTHVAVREGRILGVGSLDELKGWGEYVLDDEFKDRVMVPGMIEAHAHSLEGAMALFPYAGYFDKMLPDGSVAGGIRSIDCLIERLKELDAALSDPDAVLLVQGFDPIYFSGDRLNRHHLDQVSATRPIFVYHASGHLATVNTAMLKKHSITRNAKTAGVARDESGEPDGELQEIPAMALAESAARLIFSALASEQGIWNFGFSARNVGLTMIADLAGQLLGDPSALPAWQRIVNDPGFPCRIAIFNLAVMPGSTGNFDKTADKLKAMQRTAGSDKLRFPGVKFVLDGSIQGWTAVLNWPGYYSGRDQGQLLTVPEQLKDWMRPFHKAGISISAHCNGDRTVEIFIDAVEELLKETAWLDHRHTCQHCQLASAAQYRKMAALGICANIFTNHIWYWGDQHYELTVGPERACRMEACATATREGVHFSIHTDANVTPPGHLHTMWCAVNRVTPKGRVLGEQEMISAYDALYAATLGAAYLMHMDHEIGSIEAGKWADFTVLEDSPLDVPPMKIRDIKVWGTVVGGIKYEAPKRQAEAGAKAA